MKGPGFKVEILGFWFQSVGLRVWDFGFRVWGCGSETLDLEHQCFSC